MKSKKVVAYSVLFSIAILIFYLFIDQIFIRGRLVDTHHGVVLRAWDNLETPNTRGKINMYHAQVKLGNGAVVNIICQSICVEGQTIKVDEYQPIVGWSKNYYSGI